MQVKKPLIHEMAEQERPREKFELYGADKMSDAELLALILRTGSRSLSAVALAEEILNLNLPGSGLEKLYHLSKKDLMEIHGVGRVKAIEILALCELSVRLSKLSIILIHNHPSGDTTPSTADLTVTKRILEAGELLGIRLLDHIIVAGDKYISLKAEGYMTPSAL